MSTALTAANASAVVLSDADFEDQLEDLARDIQYAERDAIFRIASLVAKAHGLFLARRDEGGFRGWVERRLGYCRSHAYRLIAVDKWNKSVSSWDTPGTLPTSAVYLLAAPSCPKQVSDQVVERLKAGEHFSLAEVKEAIANAKGVSGSPETLEAPEPDAATPKVDGAQSADDSAKQRQRDNARLFGEDHAGRGDDHSGGGGGGDDGHGGDHNDHNGDAPDTNDAESAEKLAERRKARHATEDDTGSVNPTGAVGGRELDHAEEAGLVDQAARDQPEANGQIPHKPDRAEEIFEEFFASASVADILEHIPAAMLAQIRYQAVSDFFASMSIDAILDKLPGAKQNELLDLCIRVYAVNITSKTPIAPAKTDKKLLEDLTGTLRWTLGQEDGGSAGDGVKVIRAKLAANKRYAEELRLVFVGKGKG